MRPNEPPKRSNSRRNAWEWFPKSSALFTFGTSGPFASTVAAPPMPLTAPSSTGGLVVNIPDDAPPTSTIRNLIDELPLLITRTRMSGTVAFLPGNCPRFCLDQGQAAAPPSGTVALLPGDCPRSDRTGTGTGFAGASPYSVIDGCRLS